MSKQWKGQSSKYEDEIPKWSRRQFDYVWMPKIYESPEEDEDGSKKFSYVLIDDIPSKYKDEFLLWASNIRQVERIIEIENESIIKDKISLCVNIKYWEKWIRNKLKG